MPWPSVIQTILIGTDRRQLPEASAAELGVAGAESPVQTALEALARAALLRKAGYVPAERTGFDANDIPEIQESVQPVIPATAVRMLQRMLGGSYSEGLPEFLRLVENDGYRLPPELLPELLSQCLQHPNLGEQMRPLLGERGRWLARQNVRWQALAFDASDADWFTSAFDDRKQLLASTRSRNPLLTIAWLEKTWPQERPDHKVHFLQCLKIRLSEMDLNLLERAFQDKNREVRLAALELLVLLPDSPTLTALRDFFAEKLVAALPPAQREKHLQSSLPDLSDATWQPWFNLLSKSEKADWRNGLFQLFIRFLPPADLLTLSGTTPAEIVEQLDGGNQTAFAEALLDNLVRSKTGDWAKSVWQHYCKRFRHALWQKTAMKTFIHLHADSLMQHMTEQKIALDYESQFMLRILENNKEPWSKNLLNNLLHQYRLAVSGNMPGWHYSAVLQTAAWHCHLPDGLIFMPPPQQSPTAYQAKEWSVFQNILLFRQQMREVKDVRG